MVVLTPTYFSTGMITSLFATTSALLSPLASGSASTSLPWIPRFIRTVLLDHSSTIGDMATDYQMTDHKLYHKPNADTPHSTVSIAQSAQLHPISLHVPAERTSPQSKSGRYTWPKDKAIPPNPTVWFAPHKAQST